MDYRRFISGSILALGIFCFSVPAVSQESGQAEAVKVDKSAVKDLKKKLKEKGLSKTQIKAVMDKANVSKGNLSEEKLKQILDDLDKGKLNQELKNAQ